MELNELKPAIWEAALKDAAGLVAAYLVPEDFALSLSAASASSDAYSDSHFQSEIHQRIDFGRAVRVVELLEGWQFEPSHRLEHRVFYSQTLLSGKLHVPKYLATRVRASTVGIPVIRAARQNRTPENLFVSEVLRRTRVVLRHWTTTGGAEGKSSRLYLLRLNRIESREPWNELRSKARPALRELASSVRARIVAKVIERHPLESLLELVVEPDIAKAFKLGAGSLAFYASHDARFEDRLFELLCLGWLYGAIQRSSQLCSLNVFPTRLKRSGGEPILKAELSNCEISVYYQSGKIVPMRHWNYKRVLPVSTSQKKVGQPLRAIFDLVLKIQRPNGQTYTIIIDAKNRGWEQSEVTYKMLGYKENVHSGEDPFFGVAVFPEYGDQLGVVQLNRGSDSLYLLRVPLRRGRRAVQHLLHLLLR